MQPNGQQNYWQPQANDDGEKRPQEPLESAPATQPTPAVQSQDDLAPEAVDTTNTADEERFAGIDELPAETTITWEAADFIHHEKDATWFGIFALVVIALIVFVLFILKDYVLLVLVTAMAVALFAFARRPARVARYTLSGRGLHIGQDFHPLSDYRAFGVVRDGEFYAIMLMPINRFALATFVYFPEEYGERIVDLLGTYLPMEPTKLDIVDIAIRKIRL